MKKRIETMLKEAETELGDRNRNGYHYHSERSTELRGMIAVLTELLSNAEGEVKVCNHPDWGISLGGSTYWCKNCGALKIWNGEITLPASQPTSKGERL